MVLALVAVASHAQPLALPVAFAEPPARQAPEGAKRSAAPSVRIVQPAEGQVIGGVVRLVVEVSAAARIDQVSLSTDGALLSSLAGPPYAWSWDTRLEADGPHRVAATARDASRQEGSALITVTVDNTPPIVSLAPLSAEYVSGTIVLEARPSDVIGLRAVRFLINGEAIAELSRPPYRIEWNTRLAPNLPHTLKARALDLSGNSASSAPVTVTVFNPNAQPILTPLGPQTAEEGAPLHLRIAAMDPNGRRDALTFRATDLPPWATLDPATGEVRGTPDFTETTIDAPRREYPGVRFEVCDPEPLCVSETIMIAVVNRNRPPALLEAPADQTIREGAALELRLVASDPDGDPLTCGVRGLPRWAHMQASTCEVRGTPDASTATLREPEVRFPDIQLEACDPERLCATHTITLTVLDAQAGPVFRDLPGELTIDEGAPFTFTVQAEAAGEDAPSLSMDAPPEGAAFKDEGGGSGTLTWTPRFDQAGRHDLAFKATKADSATPATVRLTVREIRLAISGSIARDWGDPMAGVVVEFRTGSETVREVTTDGSGFYLAGGLKPGTYRVKPRYHPERGGFSPSPQTLAKLLFNPPSRTVQLSDRDQTGMNFTVKGGT